MTVLGLGELVRTRAALLFALASLLGTAGCSEPGGGAPGASVPAEAPAPAPRRTPIEIGYGAAREHVLGGADCHLAELSLEAGRYVELGIDQRGIDVGTRLVPPGGGEVLWFDATTGAWGPELAAFVTERAGRHRLEICSLEAGAAPASYALTLERPREPTAADRLRAEGFRRYSQAEAAAEADAAEEALAAFEEALARFERAGARRPEAWVLARLGLLAKARRDLETAAARFAEAAAIQDELDDPGQEAFVLSFLGRVRNDQLRLEEARETYERSLRLAEASGVQDRLENSLDNLARVHETLGAVLQAVELYDRRRLLAMERGDFAAAVDALLRIGKVYRKAGDHDEAERIVEEALALARRHGLKKAVGSSLMDLGRIHLAREESQEALDYFLQALADRDPARPDEELVELFNNLGRCHRRLGQRELALAAFERALESAKAVGPKARDREAEVLVNLASLYLLEGDFEAAAEPSERALEIFRRLGSPASTTGALKCLAEVAKARGDLEKAIDYIAEVIEMVEARRSRSALGELRATLVESKHYYYEFFVEVLLLLDERSPGMGYAERAFQVAERARARLLLDNLAGTEADIRSAADPAAVARQEELGRQMSELEMDLAKARPGEAKAEAIRHRLRQLEADHARAAARIFADYPGWSALLASAPAALEEIQAELLGDGDTQLVSFLLGEDRSYAWIVDRSSLKVVVLPAQETIERLALEAARFQSKSDQPHVRLQSELAAEAFARELLTPLVRHLTARKLLLAKDGALHYLAFAALPLPGGGEPLVERFELVEVPSASAAVALRRRQASRRPPPGELAIFADAVFQADDPRVRPARGARGATTPRRADSRRVPRGLSRTGAGLARTARGLGLGELERLTGSLDEARRILRLVPQDRRLVALGFDANRALLLSGRLGRYRILHLAGHGLAHPDLTGLVLSLYDREGRPVDGLIRPYELYGLELSADLVVLSACSTGLGSEVRGEGLLGLSRGFLYAGASRVLASLWDVDDLATAELMERFYTALLGEGLAPAEALRQAQREIRSERAWGAPHYWAGFVLQGDGT